MSEALKPALNRLARGETLAEAEAEAAFGAIIEGNATTAQIAGLLMAMRVRGESIAELTGAVRAMRARMLAVDAPADAMDVCGTGGDGQGTLNISTAVTFVLAGLGIPVVKHGNRNLSSRTGGADVLAALGVDIEPPLERLPLILAKAGCVFLFAPRHHAGLRHAAAARRELGTRTIFNLVGPMANPARVTRQLLGVFDSAWAVPVAEALSRLGTERAMIVHGGGLDELTIAGASEIVMLDHGRISHQLITPGEAGLDDAPVTALAGGDAAENAAALLALLQGAEGAYRDAVILNAAAALIVARRASNWREAAEIAAGSIDRGAAQKSLEALRRVSTIALA